MLSRPTSKLRTLVPPVSVPDKAEDSDFEVGSGTKNSCRPSSIVWKTM